MDELKPCPFCGGESKGPTWERVAIPRPYDRRYGITCAKCGLRLLGNTKESVIKAWNNRPTEQAARKEVFDLAGKVMRYPGTVDSDKRWAAFVKAFEGEFK